MLWTYSCDTKKDSNFNRQTKEGKVLRVFSSGRWLPRNQEWIWDYKHKLLDYKHKLLDYKHKLLDYSSMVPGLKAKRLLV